MAGLDHRIIWELPGQSAFYPGTPGDPDFPDRFYSTDDPNNGSRVLYRGYGWWSIAVPGSNPIITYDWTQIPVTYGTTYDARTNGTGDAGGYDPTPTTSGRQSGTLQTTLTGSGGLMLIGAGQMVNMGTVTITTDGRVHCTAHGMPNGQPIYYPTITGGVGIVAGPVSANLVQHNGWYVVANATTNDFTMQESDPITGIFRDVAITTAYTSATLMKGYWLDQVDFKCYVQSSSNSTIGLCLTTRSKFEGYTSPLANVQGQIYNLAPNMVFVEADNEFIPQAIKVNPAPDATYGYNLYRYRSYVEGCTDNHGSQGNAHLYGVYVNNILYFSPDFGRSGGGGTHNDAGMQILGGDVHVMRGCAIWGFTSAYYSATTDGTTVPVRTISAGILTGGTPIPTNINVQRNNLRGGGLYLNVDPSRPSPTQGQGGFFANQLSIINAATKSANSGDSIQCPSGVSAGTGTWKMYIPQTGPDANTDENGNPIALYSRPGTTFVEQTSP